MLTLATIGHIVFAQKYQGQLWVFVPSTSQCHYLRYIQQC